MIFYTQNYSSPLGEMLLAADETGIAGVWFVGQKYFGKGLVGSWEEGITPPLAQAKKWLDLYFSGGIPAAAPPLHMLGTPFQIEVWNLLLQIPYGQTVTYGQLAEKMAAQRGKTSMSAQAVGAAVGRNPISLIVPCHRVLGSGGELTGYAGGLYRKEALLKLEHKA